MKPEEIKKRLNTNLKKTMYRLWHAATHPHEIIKLDVRFQEYISGGWLTPSQIQDVGGTSGMRRLRDLRSQGIPIIDKSHSYKTITKDSEGNPKEGKKNINIYKLDMDDPHQFEWKLFLKEGPNYIFMTPKERQQVEAKKAEIENS